ncbi:6923_t:CDS:2 [Funneliformis geosporum]|uniref:6923_t:CDS:1 n=1 Tax=Funneliformis geosporum TaxID=1117311 RepID=A0A9W4SPZ0_9GLOM|nr:6923_t:CDS:2 [Funneliformis geosporum]
MRSIAKNNYYRELVEMLIQAKKESVTDIITRIKDYISQCSTILIERHTLAEMIKLWETERLISFLRSDSKLEGLKLNDNFFTKFYDENITGDLFLRLTGWDLKEYKMTLR